MRGQKRWVSQRCKDGSKACSCQKKKKRPLNLTGHKVFLQFSLFLNLDWCHELLNMMYVSVWPPRIGHTKLWYIYKSLLECSQISSAIQVYIQLDTRDKSLTWTSSLPTNARHGSLLPWTQSHPDTPNSCGRVWLSYRTTRVRYLGPLHFGVVCCVIIDNKSIPLCTEWNLQQICINPQNITFVWNKLRLVFS